MILTMYQNISRYFEDRIIEGGYIIFHDHADYNPVVKRFINELLTTKNYIKIQKAESLFLMQKLKSGAATKKASLQITINEGFPKIIHQSWKNENIPFDIYKEHWVNSWKINHQDWEVQALD